MADHSRMVSWEDPQELIAAAGKLSGLEFFRAIVSGELPQPPIGHLLEIIYKFSLAIKYRSGSLKPIL